MFRTRLETNKFNHRVQPTIGKRVSRTGRGKCSTESTSIPWQKPTLVQQYRINSLEKKYPAVEKSSLERLFRKYNGSTNMVEKEIGLSLANVQQKASSNPRPPSPSNLPNAAEARIVRPYSPCKPSHSKENNWNTLNPLRNELRRKRGLFFSARDQLSVYASPATEEWLEKQHQELAMTSKRYLTLLYMSSECRKGRIDLHYLTVREAKKIVRWKLADSRTGDVLSLVTGKGKHNQWKVSILRPALEMHFKEYWTVLKNMNQGVLRVLRNKKRMWKH